MDPEQIYAEVLSEEQQKGSAPAVAEGRAKAARARAEAGSPTPKEPKWWPGSQPHFEGGGAAPAGGEGAAEEPVSEEPAAAETETAPAEPPAPVAEPEAPAAAAPEPVAGSVAAPPEATPAPVAVQPAATATPPPNPVDATAPVPVAAAAPPAEPAVAPLPSGVSAGTTSGTRLRPEDESATEAQFAGQQAMYERRKLIDDLVSTGVPSVSASNSGGSRGGALTLLAYLLIPIAAIAILAGVNKGGPTAEAPGGGSTAPSGPSLTAQNVAFTTSSLSLPADKPVTLHFDNKDSTAHNVGIYDKEGGKELFKGSVTPGGAATDYKVDPLKAGTYYFQCDIHPTMNGSVDVK